jgi:vesicle-associated membrane protein 7
VQAQIDTVKDVMIENIDRVLERGEKIELLVDKTDKLNQQAFKFEKTVNLQKNVNIFNLILNLKKSKNLKNELRCRKIRNYCIIAAIVAV